MLEIFFLITFTRNLSRIAAEKGRTKMWAGLGALFWIGGELFGFVLSGLLGLEIFPGGYGLAIGLAIAGAVVSWVIVKSLPPAM